MIKKLWNNLSYQTLESLFWAQGFRRIGGIDEAGRGALAGPIFVGLVIFPPNYTNSQIRDSKLLTPNQREVLYEVIKREALAFSVSMATVEEINSLGLTKALFLAINRALSEVDEIDLLLIDGPTPVPNYRGIQRSIVKGDKLSISIAGGSILAKVTRDRYMKQLAEKYPEYRFDKHKGYATAEHLKLLSILGPTPEHRTCFKCFKVIGNRDV